MTHPPVTVADYPNRAGIQLAWRIAVAHDSRAPIVEIATALTDGPWRMHYNDATQVVAAALNQPAREGDSRDI
jgi:hypothetical protein